MISIQNIRTISRFERKILTRSWFFRIFAILALVFIIFFDSVSLFNRDSFQWVFRSLPSAILYNNIFFLSIVQSIIAIFLAPDFIKRDKKLDTSEVLFVRPMSNFDYVIGKTWGVVSVFLYLNFIVFLLSAVFILSSDQLSFSLIPFFWYFLLLSLPSLIFILGFSFFLMSLVKNQAITFLILLAYIASVLFFFGTRDFYIYDFLSAKLPLLYSDIVGFSDLKSILYHRLGYTFVGIAFIFATIFLLTRLSQSKYTKIGTISGFVFCSLIATLFFVSYLQPKNQQKVDRIAMIELSSKYFDYNVATLKKCNIEVMHRDTLGFKVSLTLKNESKKAIDKFLFSLNQGLKVHSIKAGDQTLSFKKDHHLLFADALTPLQPGETTMLSMEYSGDIDQSVCYLDADFEKFSKSISVATIRCDQQYAFVTDNYVLLTRESMWYPGSGVRYDPTRPSVFKEQFTRFTLAVSTTDSLKAISQGKMKRDSLNRFVFTSRDPLPQISLIIGNYETRKVDLDGIEVSLSTIKGHNYFDSYFSNLGDTIKPLCVEFLDSYERPLNLTYPYQHFGLVEVPAQFTSIQHSWTSAMDHSQPQMVLFPERGFNLRPMDIKTMMYYENRRNNDESQGKTKKEIEASVFNGILQSVLTSETAQVRMSSVSGQSLPVNPYNIFPNYYNYVNFISSDACPVLNYAFESYMKKASDDPRKMFFSRMTGIGDDEKANLLLNGKSLKEIISTESDKIAVNRVLRIKGAYLLSWIQKQVVDGNFDEFLRNYLYKNSYRAISYEELSGVLKEKFNVQLDEFIDEWYNSTKIPAYIASDVRFIETIDNNEVVYLARVKVSNYEDVAGLVKFSFRNSSGRSSGRDMFGGGMSSGDIDERIFLIGANETKELQMILKEPPRMVIFNTLISRNIPTSSVSYGVSMNKRDNIKAKEYERVIEKQVTTSQPDEIIVDNEDSGFSVIDPAANNPLKKFFEKEKTNKKEYVGLYGNSPNSWSLTANSRYYGEFEHSAMVVKSGDGTKMAEWKTSIKQPGYYEVYAFLELERNSQRGRPGGSGGPGGSGRQDSYENNNQGTFNYTIFHDDGIENIEYELKDATSGWNLLGTFHFSTDSTKVVLNNKTELQLVLADAIKWVKEGNENVSKKIKEDENEVDKLAKEEKKELKAEKKIEKKENKDEGEVKPKVKGKKKVKN